MTRHESRAARTGRFLEQLVLSPMMAVAAYLAERALHRLLAPKAGGAAPEGAASRQHEDGR